MKLRALGLIPAEATPEKVVPLLTKHKLTTNHTRDDAAKRGTDIHALADTWAKTAQLPAGDGHAAALRNFIEIEKPRPVASEVLVGSRRGAYAGTFDLLAMLPKLDAYGVIDWKTKTKPAKGKPVAYDQHHLQLAGYEAARREMGHNPSDFQAVVNLYPDGTYAIVQGLATADQWRAALFAYRSLIELQQAIRSAA